MESALYSGRVRHRRFAPVPNEFTYGVFLVYLDLAELDEVFRGRLLWSTSRPAPAWFRRADHLGDPAVPLDVAVRDLVETRTGSRPAGPIRLLTHLRYWGYCMNPVSFHYCFDAAGERVETIVADVSNTPWNERHPYLLERAGLAPGEGAQRWELAKEFHVSPFLGMDMEYAWSFTAPSDTLAVHMENREGGERVLDATLTLRRREITGGSLAGVLLRHPFMTVEVIAGIYWQAFRLWRKRTPYFEHPGGVRDGGRAFPAGDPRGGQPGNASGEVAA